MAPVHTSWSLRENTWFEPGPETVSVVTTNSLAREASSANVTKSGGRHSVYDNCIEGAEAGAYYVRTWVVGALTSVVNVDVPFTIASSDATTVSAYTVSPSGCTLTEAMPATVASWTYVGTPEGAAGVNRE